MQVLIDIGAGISVGLGIDCFYCFVCDSFCLFGSCSI
jgi:hypothetical protein